jgi:hypothetical protein
VGRAGIGPATDARYKLAALTPELPASWPPRSRTARYLCIRQDPSTGWVVATVRMRQESDLQGREARLGSSQVPSPVGLRIHERKDRESDPEGDSRRSPVFGTGAVASRLALPCADGAGIEPACGASRSLRFPAGHLAKLGQPSRCGRCRDRTCARLTP